MTEQELKDKWEQAIKRGGEIYADHYMEGLIDGRKLALHQLGVMPSLHLADFIEEIGHMQGLYKNARFTQAEATRDKLAEQLDDLMRLG